MDRVRPAGELWRDRDTTASPAAADGLCRADELRIFDELVAGSVYERLFG
jgi:hypothetical protein